MSALFEIEGIALRLGRQQIYDDFIACLPDTGVIGILGPNGCGKSSLLRMLAGLSHPDQGRILLRGVDVAGIAPAARARQIAFLPQNPPDLPEMSVEGLVGKGRTPWRHPFLPPSQADRNAVDRALAATGIAELRGRRMAQLSGGQRQRAWIAMALAQETGIILLDEPTSWLDLPHEIALMQLLRDLADDHGRRVVIVLHDLTLAARFCDHILGLNGGRLICAGPPARAITPETVAGLYGIRALVQPDPVFGHPVVYPCV